MAEEEIPIQKDLSIPYIGASAVQESSFHSFDFVSVVHQVAAVEPSLPRAVVSMAKEMVKCGYKPGQGLGTCGQGIKSPLEPKDNKEGYGLGFTPTRAERKKLM